MKWIKITFIVFFVTLIILINGSDVKAWDSTITCPEYGYGPTSNCRDCLCNNIRAQTAYPSCSDVSYGTVTCYDNDGLPIDPKGIRQYCHPSRDFYPNSCTQWKFNQDFSYSCDLTEVLTGVDHTEWSYHVCWNGSGWNNSPKATYGDAPAPTPPSCNKTYFGCGTFGCTATQKHWEDSCGNSGCETKPECTAATPTNTPPPTPTTAPTNTPTPIPQRITMRTVAGQYCSPNLKVTWLQLIKDTDGLQKDVLSPNATLNPGQSYTGTFNNYSCINGDYYRVRVRYSYPASNQNTTDIWDYAIQCPSYENFSIPCPSPTPIYTPTPTNPPAYGENEGMSAAKNSCNLVGWACDESDLNRSIGVDLYVDGPRLTGTPLPHATASLPGRPTSQSGYCQGDSNHGYSVTIPSIYRDSIPHIVYGYAAGINNSGSLDDTHPDLIGNPKEFTCGEPPITPVQVPWTQLSNTSFQGVSGIASNIPASPLGYGGGAGQPYFIVGNSAPVRDAGAVTANGTIDLGTLNPSRAVSEKKWSKENYTSSGLNIASTIQYIKAKKSIVNVNTLDDIQPQKINVFSGKTISINTAQDGEKMYGGVFEPIVPKTPIMIILENSTLDINITQFNPFNRPLVIIVSSGGGGGDGFQSQGKITFASTTTNANGIFIAENVDTGSNADLGLQIQGNLITNGLTNNRGRSTGSNNSPSLYVIQDMYAYTKLLDFMSKYTYEWTQLQ